MKKVWAFRALRIACFVVLAVLALSFVVMSLWNWLMPTLFRLPAISFWQSKENAEAYSRAGYPEELKALGKVVEGTPQLQTYEVSNSTIHKIAARA